MSATLYPYYERELYFLRQAAQGFARQYPATAGRLLLEPNQSADPHVERLLEGAALLAGRVQHKLDDEFPELTDALLGLLYPHFLAPIPSCTVLQFDPDPARIPPKTGFTLPAGTRLHTQPVAGTPCRFRTTFPVTLWPLTVRDVEWTLPPFPRAYRPPAGSAAVLRLAFEAAPGTRLADMPFDRLRLFLDGDPQLVADLYEAVLNRAVSVVVRDPDAGGDGDDRRVTLRPESCLSAAGFGQDEGLLPAPSQALPGYRLLTEFFAFPQKFWFVDLHLPPAARRAASGRRMEVLVFVDRTRPLLEQGVGPAAFRLGCTPAVNLFERTAEPVPLTHARSEYRVVPDVAAPLGAEVYSVDAVQTAGPGVTGAGDYRPFFGGRPGAEESRRAYWHAVRRASVVAGDRGTDVYLSLVDSDFRPDRPADEVLVVKTTCTNRDLPDRLRQSGERPAFEVELSAPVARVRCLHGPTPPLRPPPRRGGMWRLVSHLNLNHLTVNADTDAGDALRGILALYDFSAGDSGERRAEARSAVEGVIGVMSRQVVRRVGTLAAGGFVRGLRIDLELDEEKYIGTGAFLFASVLERFLALHAAVNSFTQLAVRTVGSPGPLKVWPPRAGEQPLL
jgi:type VI secretion system protein ImpG